MSPDPTTRRSTLRAAAKLSGATLPPPTPPKTRTTRTSRKAMRPHSKYVLGSVQDAQAVQWSKPIPEGGRPHITCVPQELLDKITQYTDGATLAILAVTCRAMRIRLPRDFYEAKGKKGRGKKMKELSLDDCIKDADGQTTGIRMWELLKEYMGGDFLAGVKRRDYAGNYGVFKFLDVDQYKAARDVYWENNPPLPFDYLEVMTERMELEAAIKREGAVMWGAMDNMTNKDLKSGLEHHRACARAALEPYIWRSSELSTGGPRLNEL